MHKTIRSYEYDSILFIFVEYLDRRKQLLASFISSCIQLPNRSIIRPQLLSCQVVVNIYKNTNLSLPKNNYYIVLDAVLKTTINRLLTYLNQMALKEALHTCIISQCNPSVRIIDLVSQFSCQNFAERKSPTKYFSYFVLASIEALQCVNFYLKY